MLFETKEKAINHFNLRFAIVEVEGKVKILAFADETLTLRSIPDFKHFHAHFEYKSPASQGDFQRHKSAADAWIKSPDAIRCKGVVFDPTTTDTLISRSGDFPQFNLFRGFAVKPKKGNCNLFLRHVHDVICAGNQELYDYIMAWLANLFQKPAEPPGTALVLQGSQGTGKSFFANNIAELLRPANRLHIASSDLLVGRFTAHFAGKLLIFGDEAFWAGDKSALGRLKALITERRLTVEAKGQNPFEIENFARLIIASNERWVVPAALDERRFCVLRVSDRHKRDYPWFAAIQSQLDNSGREALLYHLLHEVDLKKVQLREIPQTQALAEQKLETASTVVRFWYDALVEGRFFDVCERQGFIFKSVVYEDYKNFPGAKSRLREPESAFWKETRKIFHGLKFSKRTLVRNKHKTRAHAVDLPPLAEARKLFEKFIGFEPGTLDTLDGPWPL